MQYSLLLSLLCDTSPPPRHIRPLSLPCNMNCLMWTFSGHTGWVCVRLPVPCLLPTAHSPGCRWDAPGSSAEPVLCAALGSCIQNEAPPACTSRCIASAKGRKTKGIFLTTRSHALRCLSTTRCKSLSRSSSFREGSGEPDKEPCKHSPGVCKQVFPSSSCAVRFIHDYLSTMCAAT